MQTQPTKILRIAAVMDRTGLAKPTIYQKIARAEFPASIRLGPRAAGWLEHEIEAWIADRIRDARYK
ncbi:helix-turn-helix transcriptional regulator [Caballeronia glebae]|uniref:helix-turn-helix transcriptional regulator n=1 Tax=Caballeronia glebae TaxID=1777143 RepID=UPI0038BA90F2